MFPIYLDLETTDLGEDARIVQLAYKNSLTDEVTNDFFKPPLPIDFGAMAVHHVTNEMVADKPVFEGSQQKKKLIELLKENTLVAHNAPFDIRILKNEGVLTPKYIDTLRVSQHLIKSKSYKLQYLRYSLDLNVDGSAHDALGDVMVLEKLFEKLAGLIAEKFAFNSNDEVTAKLLELTQTPLVLTTFTFGKYKGREYAEVAVTDRGYLEWLHGSEIQKQKIEQNVNLVYTLQYYLKVSR